MADLIVSVKEARKLLGESVKNMTDEEIEGVIINLDAIARDYIRGVMEGTIQIPKNSNLYSQRSG